MYRLLGVYLDQCWAYRVFVVLCVNGTIEKKPPTTINCTRTSSIQKQSKLSRVEMRAAENANMFRGFQFRDVLVDATW